MFALPPVEAAASDTDLRGLVFATPRDGGGAGGGSRGGDGAGTGLNLRLYPDVEAAGKAREALERLDAHVERGVLEDLHLLVTELVTNSVRHADAKDEPVRVEVSVTGDHVFVAVEDGGSGFRPSPRAPDAPRDSGWGLHLVERLSSRWGVTGDGRTRVWLELERSRSAAAA